VVTKLIKTPCSLTVLAHSLYADGTRADEILSLNRVRNPFLVPAGTLLKVPSR
jgi:nucleoid-associated protein YgaU